MTYLSTSDLSQSLRLQQDSQRIRSSIVTLTNELSSGRKSDVRSTVSGDYGILSALENDLTRLTGFETAAKENSLIIGALQEVFARVNASMSDLSNALLLTQNTAQPEMVENAAQDARVRMDSVIAALNTRLGDRTILAGAATDGPALAGADVILGDLMPLLAGETTAAGVETIIDSYFASGGGFDTVGYLGATLPVSPVEIADGNLLSQPITAQDDAVRTALAGFAKATVLEEGALVGLIEERANLAQAAGEALFAAAPGIIHLQAAAGTREEQIDQAQARNAGEKSALELTRSKLVSADPAEVVTKLKAAETQLTALYTVTARLSALSLTSFLR